MNLSDSLKVEKFPYFLTSIFIIISIQFNYIVGKVFDVPILQYQFTTGASAKYGEFYQMYFVVKNLSSDKLINNLNIQLNYIGNSKSLIRSPDIDAIPPASIILNDPTYTRDKLAYYKIQVIQPGLSYRLIYYTNTPESFPIISFECNQPVEFAERSIYTLILDHHILLNFLLMIFLLFMSIVYVLKLK